MKVRLLKKIRNNLYITRSTNGYELNVKNSYWLDGAKRKDPVDKDNLNEAIRSIIIYTARLNFKRKGRLFY